MATRRAKGTGSIIKRGTKYYFKVTINNKRITRRMPNVTNDEEADLEATRLYTIASAKTKEQIAMFAGEARGVIKNAKAIPLSEAFGVFEKSTRRPNCNDNTLRQHRSYWNLFLDFLHDPENNIESIDENKINAFFAELKNPKSNKKKNPRTYNCILKTLKLVFRIVYPHVSNPCQFIQKLDEKTQSHKSIDEMQLKKVFDSVDKDYPLSILHRDEMKILFRIGAYTGMRLKDCCLLEWEQVNLKNKIIKAIPNKTARTGRRVTIPIHPDLYVYLNSLPHDGKYVLPAVAERYIKHRTSVNITTSRIVWYAIGEKPKAGERPKRQEGYGFHSLRHAFVSFCANAGVPLAVVQEIVGHGSTTVTRIYTHFATDTLRSAVNAIPGKQNTTLSDSEKLAKIEELISGKKKLSKLDQEILDLI